MRYYNRGVYIQSLRKARQLCPSCEIALKPKTKFKKKTKLVDKRSIPFQPTHIYRGNIPLWMHKYSGLPGFGTAILMHGDSRHLLDLLAESVSASVSSPPYADSIDSKSNGIDWKKVTKDYPGRKMHDARIEMNDKRHSGYYYGETPGQLGAMKAQDFDAAIASPPFLQSSGGTNPSESLGRGDPNLLKRHAAGNAAAHAYGESEGQLSSMKSDGFDAAISSSPFGEQETGRGIAASMNGVGEYPIPNNHTGKHGYQDQGETPGQLAAMPTTNFDAAVTSSPYKTGGHHKHQMDSYDNNGGGQFDKENSGFGAGDTMGASVSSPPYDEARIGRESGQAQAGRGDQYGDNPAQLGGADDFWMASRQIVEQVYIALRPGGHAVWVCKDYVKNKERVPFSDQWRQLCEAVGFETVHEHHALLIRNKRTQIDLEGNHHTTQTESKSFFRRVAENKGSPRIDYEVVYCMVKPL